MKWDVDRAMKRTRSYWYEDGLTEIAAGCIFVLIGVLFAVEAAAPAGSLPSNFSSLGLPILIIGGYWLAQLVVQAIKARVTYPRTGYVAYRQVTGGRRRALTAAVALVTALLVAALASRWADSRVWMPALQGVAVGAFLLYLGHFLGLERFYVLAVLSVLFGVAASIAGLGDTAGSAAYFAATGLAVSCSGALTLWNYLKHTTPAGD